MKPATGVTIIATQHGDVHEVELQPSEVVTVGRDPENTLVLRKDSSVSRNHARLGIDERGVWVEDLGSANGTRVRTSPATFSDGETSSTVEDARDKRTYVPRGAVVEIGNTYLTIERTSEQPSSVDGVVVADAAMKHVYRVAEQVATSSLSVLLLGESGVGKDVLARAIHARSRRAGAMIAVNCGAIAPSLLEAELFGHERGAFTGAIGAKAGMVEAAHQGTLLLDEIGELPIGLQVKLLRVVEDRTVTRVGATASRTVEVRFLAATNRDLDVEVSQGRFRLDLLHRLDGVRITIPPLRERPQEIELLARKFLTAAAATHRRALPVLSEDALVALVTHPWPGNVRELKNAIERAVVTCDGAAIEPSHLALTPTRGNPSATPLAAVDEEHARIQEALIACAGNQTRAAELLGISRRSMLRRLDKYRILRPRGDRLA